MDIVAWIITVLCIATAVSLLVEIVRDAPVGNVSFGGLVAVEAGLLVQLVLGIIAVAQGNVEGSGFVFIGYLVGALLLLPVGFFWAASEKSRSGTAVLLVAVLVVPVLLLRLHHLVIAGS